MKHNNPPQFYLTIESPCPYLEGEKERKVFTQLQGENAQHVQNALSEVGFRRSQNIVYRPACLGCAKCLSARIVTSEFTPTKSQKRILRKNTDILREVRRCDPTEEQYDLFKRYLHARHLDGGMADMQLHDYANMVSDVKISSRLIEYRMPDEMGRPGQLVGCVLTDIVNDGISLVYSFFDPDFASRSLGKFIILDHIELCKEARLNYAYLGYWVKNSRSMDYKRHYDALEVFHGNDWVKPENLDALTPEPTNAQALLLQAHRKLSG